MRNPEYLGDGVYVFFDGMRFRIMANSHDDPTDTVYLGQSEIEMLIEFYKSILEGANSNAGRGNE